MTDHSGDQEDVSRFGEEEQQHGWAPDGESGPGTAAVAADKAFDASQAGPSGPGRVVSEEEREGIPPYDSDARSAHGVGESSRRSAEDVARAEGPEDGRVEEGTKGPSERPVGSSTPEHYTGVGAQDSSDDAPTMSPGDQGG